MPWSIVQSPINRVFKVVDYEVTRCGRIQGEAFVVEGRNFPVVMFPYSGLYDKIKLTILTLNQTEYNDLWTVLNSAANFTLNSAMGPSWTVRMIDEPRQTQLRAAPTGGETTPLRWTFNVDFQVVQVA